MTRILLVDDEPNLRALYARLLGLEGYEVVAAGKLSEARTKLKADDFHLVLLDVRLPDGTGLDWIADIKAQHTGTEVILLTAYGTVPQGVEAMKRGAYDYLVKGESNDQILATVAGAVEKAELRRKVERLQARHLKGFTFDDLVGNDAAFRVVVNQARQVAPTEANVLVLGETGTGKELIAQAIHNASAREGEFVAVNCAAIPSAMLESELFGYRKGAFTGALSDKRGLLEEASGGTLFLDEIGDMPLELQAKLLRALDAQAFIKLGDTKPTVVRLRVVAATHRNLKAMVAEQTFRADLYYRLAVVVLALPPLRRRGADVLALAQLYLERYRAKLGKADLSLSTTARALLQAYPWPGNVRELKNAIERAVILATGPEVEVADLPAECREPEAEPVTNDTLDALERQQIERVLAENGGNKTQTARKLGIGLATLYRKLERYGL